MCTALGNVDLHNYVIKVFWHCQVEKRALEIWGSKENLQQEKEQREENKEKAKQKKFDKKVKGQKSLR